MNAQTNPNFGALLDQAPSETERPKPLPQGTYVTMIQGLPRQDKSTKKGTEYVEFTHKLLSAGEDVDAEELAAMGGIGDKTMRNTYYITENSLWRLKDFLSHCGIDVDAVGSYREAIDETPGKQVSIYIKHVPSEDGTAIYANIGKTLAVE